MKTITTQELKIVFDDEIGKMKDIFREDFDLETNKKVIKILQRILEVIENKN